MKMGPGELAQRTNGFHEGRRFILARNDAVGWMIFWLFSGGHAAKDATAWQLGGAVSVSRI